MRVILLFLISLPVQAIELSNSKWLQIAHNGYAIECPDAIELDLSTYKVFNDCYGDDPANPVIETGEYLIAQHKIKFVRIKITAHESILKAYSKNNNHKSFFVKKHTESSLVLESEGRSIYFKALK